MEILNFLKNHLVVEGIATAKIHMVGVDLDPNLISRAKEKYQQSIELHTMDVSQEVKSAYSSKSRNINKYFSGFICSTAWCLWKTRCSQFRCSFSYVGDYVGSFGEWRRGVSSVS